MDSVLAFTTTGVLLAIWLAGFSLVRGLHSGDPLPRLRRRMLVEFLHRSATLSIFFSMLVFTGAMYWSHPLYWVPLLVAAISGLLVLCAYIWLKSDE